MGMKKCAMCKKEKSIDNFRITNIKKNIRYSYCHECSEEYHRNHVVKKKYETKKCPLCGKVKKANEFYIRNNLGYLQSKCSECSNKIEKDSRKINGDEVRAKENEWRIKNREKLREYNIEYYYQNKEKFGKWIKNKMKTDVMFRVGNNISRSIRQGLKRNKSRTHWEIVLGYTIDDLKRHLESLFRKGMSWDNYGKFGWHIDHIIPKSWWRYKDIKDSEFKQCWALANLQPLWAEENHIKSNFMQEV